MVSRWWMVSGAVPAGVQPGLRLLFVPPTSRQFLRQWLPGPRPPCVAQHTSPTRCCPLAAACSRSMPRACHAASPTPTWPAPARWAHQSIHSRLVLLLPPPLQLLLLLLLLPPCPESAAAAAVAVAAVPPPLLLHGPHCGTAAGPARSRSGHLFLACHVQEFICPCPHISYRGLHASLTTPMQLFICPYMRHLAYWLGCRPASREVSAARFPTQAMLLGV